MARSSILIRALSFLIGILTLASGCATRRIEKEPRSETVTPTNAMIASVDAPPGVRSSAIRGKCKWYRGPGDSVGAPCSDLVIVLKDADSKHEVTRKNCDPNGEFAIRVQEGRRYLLGAVSPRQDVVVRDNGPFTAGQDVFMMLLK